MSDFHQHGPITTLHRLSDSHRADLESAMFAASAKRPTTVILPCHADDAARRRPLMRILGELEGMAWVSQILVPVNGVASRDEIEAIRTAHRGRARWLWTDGPAARQLRQQWISADLLQTNSEIPGKGMNVWLALGFALAGGRDGIIAVHDADISNYRGEMLVRLCAPVLHPEMAYDFAKGYYRRVTEGVMFGRVTRLLVAPLLRAAVRVLGHQPLLDHLSAFRYPLAGECALSAKTARELPVTPDWGLELGWLCEVHRRTPPNRICQVELGANYEHKHRPLHGVRGRAGLIDLARGIACTLMAELRSEGLTLDDATQQALASAYERLAAEAVDRYAHDAVLNSLRHDASAERVTVGEFAHVLEEAIASPALPKLALPAWSRVFAQVPHAADALRELEVAD